MKPGPVLFHLPPVHGRRSRSQSLLSASLNLKSELDWEHGGRPLVLLVLASWRVELRPPRPRGMGRGARPRPCSANSSTAAWGGPSTVTPPVRRSGVGAVTGCVAGPPQPLPMAGRLSEKDGPGQLATAQQASITRDVRHMRDSPRGKLHCNAYVSLQSGRAVRRPITAAHRQWRVLIMMIIAIRSEPEWRDCASLDSGSLATRVLTWIGTPSRSAG